MASLSALHGSKTRTDVLLKIGLASVLSYSYLDTSASEIPACGMPCQPDSWRALAWAKP